MKWFLSLWLMLASALALASNPPLRPEEAFRVSLQRLDAQTLEARFDIEPGHYLYRERFAFAANQPLRASLPAGQIKDEPETGKVEIYPAPVAIRLESDRAIADDLAVTIRYQGCEEGRLCYPAQEVQLKPGQGSDVFSLALKRNTDPARALLLGQTPSPTLAPVPTPVEQGFGEGYAHTFVFFLLAGLGLSFTACLYPLIPIVSGLILGNRAHSRLRMLGLTFAYVQGLALSYTLIGLAAAATGTFLTVALQQPIVIGLFALFFVLMALAMFGVFNFHLPTSWLSRITDWANRLPGGHFGPVFVMGAISSLIVGPCNLPPLAAALAYLGRSGDLLLGGGALYAMALGMGLPLLALAWFGHSILPRLSGRQMQAFRTVFGILLLGFAVWVARPLWQAPAREASTIEVVRSRNELDAAVLAARGKPVMVDFYADWCVACLELEKNTLQDATVKNSLRDWVVIRADITANTEESRLMLSRFGLFAPPVLMFFDRSGMPQAEPVIGFIDAEGLQKKLAGLSSGQSR